MRFFCVVICLGILWSQPAVARSDISVSIAERGLAATISTLEATEARTATDSFALAGCRFLRAIEIALQTRYAHGIGAQGLSDIPVLRLSIEPNPDPEPFRPELIEEIFVKVGAGMAGVRTELEQVDATDELALEVALEDIWFDIDGSGTRGAGEGLVEATGNLISRRWNPETSTRDPQPTVRFDTADAAWLSAYSHVLSGVGELVQAYSPTQVIEDVLAASDELHALISEAPPNNALDYLFRHEADSLAMVYHALQQQPDPAHTRAAAEHFLNMIRHNRVFWKRVELETDDDLEWIPSSRQKSALGIEMPPETGPFWLAVLDDAEALLTGEKLIPHWRMGAAAGINMAAFLDDPAPVDVVGWIHGMGLLRYAERGTPVDAASWRQFSRMLRGGAVLMAVWLN